MTPCTCIACAPPAPTATPAEASTPVAVDPRDAELTSLRAKIEVVSTILSRWHGADRDVVGVAEAATHYIKDLEREGGHYATLCQQAHDALDAFGIERGGTPSERISLAATVRGDGGELTSLRTALEAQTLANGVLRGRVAEVEVELLATRAIVDGLAEAVGANTKGATVGFCRLLVDEVRLGKQRGDAFRGSILSLLGELPDSDMTDYGIVGKLRTRIVGAETHIAMHPGRYEEDVRWAVVKAVVKELGDEAVDIDATVQASVVRVALAALRAVVS